MHMKRLLLLTLFASIMSIGHAQILLINDTFDRTGTLGVAPDSTPTYEIGSNTWIGNNNGATGANDVTTDTTGGGEAVMNDLGDGSYPPYPNAGASIGVPSTYLSGGNLIVGDTYTLSFTLTTSEVSNIGGDVSAGFADSSVPTDYALVDDSAQNSDHVDYTYQADLVPYGTQYDTGVTDSGAGNAATVVMTLLAGVGGSDTLGVNIDSTPVFSQVLALGNLDEISIGGTVANGTVQDLSLDVSPEPSTYALMLGGLAFLGFLIRRKRALFS